MIDWVTNNSPLTNPGINSNANDAIDHLTDALRYLRGTLLRSMQGREKYVCDCSKCGFKYYTEIKQCNCPHCGCDGERFRCSELK